MHDKAYVKPAEDVDMAAEESGIRRGLTIAFAATIMAFIVAYHGLPLVMDLPVDLPERLAFAALACAGSAVVLLVAVLMVSTGRRHSPQDIGGQAAGPPSPGLAVRAAFLQNTLEQTLLAWGFYLGLAAIAGGAWLALVPAGLALFYAGRVLFFLGYRHGAGGRALGMGLTMMPSVSGYAVIAALLVLG